jgi:hypothetical protein
MTYKYVQKKGEEQFLPFSLAMPYLGVRLPLRIFIGCLNGGVYRDPFRQPLSWNGTEPLTRAPRFKPRINVNLMSPSLHTLPLCASEKPYCYLKMNCFSS